MPGTKRRSKKQGDNAHLLAEDIRSLSQAAAEIPSQPHFSTVLRWSQRGINDVRLETYKIGGRLITSRQAVDRFLHATQG